MSLVRWQCANCKRWNSASDDFCPQCGSTHKVDELSPEEKEFYTGTAPAILAELRSIRVLLERRLK